MNTALVRRVWDADKFAIYITNEKGFEKLENNDPDAILPVGFPREDVFEFDPNWFSDRGNSKGENPRWNELKVFG